MSRDPVSLLILEVRQKLLVTGYLFLVLEVVQDLEILPNQKPKTNNQKLLKEMKNDSTLLEVKSETGRSLCELKHLM